MKYAIALALALAAAAPPAQAATKNVLVLNAGGAAIFGLYVGHAAAGEWSRDLLGFAQVVDVSRGRDVPIDVDESVCTYDVKAVYADGYVEVLPDVDLCSAKQLQFDHS